MFLRREQSLPIGLDLGQESVKLLQLQAGPRGLSVRAAARQELNDESRGPDQRSAALNAVSKLLRSGGFSGRRVITCLPRELVHLKNIRLPLMPVSEVADAVEFEAANAFGFQRSDILLRHIVAGEVRQGEETRLEVMMLAAKLAEVDSFVESLHRAGCQLEALDFEPNAIFRGAMFQSPTPQVDQVQVVIDIGLRRTQVIIGRDKDLCFFKPVDVGARRLDAAVAKKLSISESEASILRCRVDTVTAQAQPPDESIRHIVSDALRPVLEELSREVALCLRYCSVTFRGQRPSRVRLVGGAAASAQLREMFSHSLAIPVEPALALNRLDIAHCLPGGNTSELWTLPLGLSLRAAAKDSIPRLASGPLDVSAVWEASHG